MNKNGFTLIELLIASAIAAVLALLLFTSVDQLNKFIPVIDARALLNEKTVIINTQLERDLAGATIPHEFYLRQKNTPAPTRANKEASEKNKIANENVAKKEEAEKKDKAGIDSTGEKTIKPLEKVFNSTNAQGVLRELSFITNNPLQTFWSKTSGTAKPRIVRVYYTLLEDETSKGNKKSFRLLRHESPNVEYIQRSLGDTKNEYVIAEGIKSLSVEYTYAVQEEKKEDQKAAQKPKREIKKKTDWLLTEQKDMPQKNDDSQEKVPLPLVPHIAEFTLELWDPSKKQSKTFLFKIKIQSEAAKNQQKKSKTLIEAMNELFKVASR